MRGPTGGVCDRSARVRLCGDPTGMGHADLPVIGAHFSISGEIAPYVRVIEFKDIEAAIAR